MKLRRDEVNALQLACEKISKNFEKAKSGAHMYKQKLESIEAQYQEEKTRWERDHQGMIIELQTKESEKYQLNSDLEQATNALEKFKDQKDVERQGALFA